MADRSVELFAALRTALAGDATLTTVLGGSSRVHSAMAPAGAPPPYVVIGDETAADYGASDGDSQEHTVTMHVWTEEPGKLKCLQAMSAVRAALHDVALALSGGLLVNLRCEFKETFRDPDGVSQHGVMRFRAVTTG